MLASSPGAWRQPAARHDGGTGRASSLDLYLDRSDQAHQRTWGTLNATAPEAGSPTWASKSRLQNQRLAKVQRHLLGFGRHPVSALSAKRKCDNLSSGKAITEIRPALE